MTYTFLLLPWQHGISQWREEKRQQLAWWPCPPYPTPRSFPSLILYPASKEAGHLRPEEEEQACGEREGGNDVAGDMAS